MKSYPSISGIKKEFNGLPCIAFDKIDGSNLRFLWRKKVGWCNFGTRNRLFDRNDPDFGSAIDLFLNKYGDSIPSILSENKEYRGVAECIVFCEFFGPHSFAGFHEPSDPKDVLLFDVAPNKKGIIGSRQFIKHFGLLDIPKVVYDGFLTDDFINDVRDGKFDVFEGVVVKGNNPKGREPHNLWMTKIKTKKWLQELKRKSEYIESLRSVLEENEREQSENISNKF